MFELIALFVFIWLLVNAITLALKLTWGVAKIIASILMVVALPLLIVCWLFIGGIALLAPLAVLGIACVILKACV